MSERFHNVPLEEDTILMLENEETLGGYPVLFQLWFWNGIYARSAIFIAEDVADLDEEPIKDMVRDLPLYMEDSEVTFTRNANGYTFVNFNFILESELD